MMEDQVVAEEEEKYDKDGAQNERDALKEKIKELERRIRQLESGEAQKKPARKEEGES
jgi:hypothetical protein